MKSRKRSLATALMLTFATLLASGCGGSGAEAGAGGGDISQEQFLAMQKSEPELLVLDVRTPEEYSAGHVPGARLIPHTSLKARLDEIADYKDKPVVVYCRSGYRAGIARSILEEAGFSRVLHLDGDMNGWIAAKRPIER